MLSRLTGPVLLGMTVASGTAVCKLSLSRDSSVRFLPVPFPFHQRYSTKTNLTGLLPSPLIDQLATSTFVLRSRAELPQKLSA